MTLYGPWKANDWSESTTRSQFRKDQFTWHGDLDAYACPADHLRKRVGCHTRVGSGGREVVEWQYRGDAHTGQACPLRGQCSTSPGEAKEGTTNDAPPQPSGRRVAAEVASRRVPLRLPWLQWLFFLDSAHMYSIVDDISYHCHHLEPVRGHSHDAGCRHLRTTGSEPHPCVAPTGPGQWDC